MKSNDIATKINQEIFGIETHRFRKIVTGLRGHEYCGKALYPDSRVKSADVTPDQVAHLLRVLALNLNPVGSDFHRQIAIAHSLRDQAGVYLIDTIAEYLSNPDLITERGLMRISFSQDRDTVVFCFRSPLYQEALKYAKLTRFVVREHDQVFGQRGPLAFERFSIVKQSALLKVAGLLAKEVDIKP